MKFGCRWRRLSYEEGTKGWQTEARGQKCERCTLAVLREKFATAQIDESGILTWPDQDDALGSNMRGHENLSSALVTVKNGGHITQSQFADVGYVWVLLRAQPLLGMIPLSSCIVTSWSAEIAFNL